MGLNCDFSGQADDQFGAAVLARGHDLPSGAICTDREPRHGVAENKPCVFGFMLTFEFGVAGAPGSHQSGKNGGDANIVPGYFVAQTF